MQDCWTAAMDVIVAGFAIDDEYFTGDFDSVREMIEAVQDDYVAKFGDTVTFDISLNPLNV